MKQLLVAALLLVLALRGEAADQKTKNKYEPTKDDIDALIKLKKVVGKVSKLEGSSKGFTLIYENMVPDQPRIDRANAPLLRQQLRLANDQQKALTIKNAGKRATRLQDLANRQASVQLQVQANVQKYVKKVRKDFQLQGMNTTKVRTKKLPVQYDDKGNVKEYTKTEKEELKGKDKTLPGYEANWDSLAEGQSVQVTVKAHKKKKDKKEETNKDKKDEVDKDLLDDDRPLVTMIVIQKEPDADKASKKEK